MLEKKVPFCIDHFSIATTHRDRPIDLVTKLGFTTADCYTDRTVHFIFENSYFELCTYQLNTTITWLTQSVPATNLPKVHSYRLSVKGTDPNPMRNALIEGGIETSARSTTPSASMSATVRRRARPVTRPSLFRTTSPLPTFSSAAPPIWPRS